MTKYLPIFFTACIFIACTTNEEIDQEKEINKTMQVVQPESDTTYVYWPVEFDTTRTLSEVRIANTFNKLEIKSYSLNDSAVIRINTLNKGVVYKDIYHNQVTELVLTNGDDTIISSLLNKETFKDSLIGEFYDHSVLGSVKYDGIRSNRLFFIVHFYVPDTDWVVRCDMGLFYRTKKKGQIGFWNVDDIIPGDS